jgi:elongation factor G
MHPTRSLLENITFPEPVISVAIEPKTTADQDKMSEALRKLAEEDPTFRVRYRSGHRTDDYLRDGRAAPGGFGRPHAARVPGAGAWVDRRFLTASRSPCRLARRNTAISSKPAVAANMGTLFWKCYPVSRAAALYLKMALFGGHYPREYIPAVEKGVREAAEAGVLAGYPVTDVKVRLYDGSFPRSRLERNGFQNGWLDCLQRRCSEGRTSLQEPIMKVEVVVSEEFWET